MAKRIADLEKEVEMWQNMYEQILKKNTELIASADKEFENSSIRKSMQAEIERQKMFADIAEVSYKHIEQSNVQLKRENLILLKDNIALLEEHNVEYWKGITDARRDTFYVEQLEERVDNLTGEVNAKNNIISYLRALLDDQLYMGTEGYIPKEKIPDFVAEHIGRPAKIDESTKRRIRKLRRSGHTIRKIAEVEGLSIGAVQKIVKDIKFQK